MKEPTLPVESKLIEWLQEFGKHRATTKTNNLNLEEQLLHLSKSYNEAQQKLLHTETELMHQTVHSQKLRSLIELLKEIMCGNIDDESILTFINQLERQEPQSVFTNELNEIRHILEKNKLATLKKKNQEGKFDELKKQIIAKDQQIKQIQCQYEELKNYAYELEQSHKDCGHRFKQLADLQELQTQHSLVDNERLSKIEELEQQKGRYEKDIGQSKQLISQIALLVSKFTPQNKGLRSLDEKVKNLCAATLPDVRQTLVQGIRNLARYKKNYQQLEKESQDNQLSSKTVRILKEYLSDQAASLLREYEIQREPCIQIQLRNLAALERKKLYQMEHCQKELWKYKTRCLVEAELSQKYATSRVGSSLKKFIESTGKEQHSEKEQLMYSQKLSVSEF